MDAITLAILQHHPLAFMRNALVSHLGTQSCGSRPGQLFEPAVSLVAVFCIKFFKSGTNGWFLDEVINGTRGVVARCSRHRKPSAEVTWVGRKALSATVKKFASRVFQDPPRCPIQFTECLAPDLRMQQVRRSITVKALLSQPARTTGTSCSRGPHGCSTPAVPGQQVECRR